MHIFQDDNVKIHQAQIGKGWLGGSMKNWCTSWWKKHHNIYFHQEAQTFLFKIL